VLRLLDRVLLSPWLSRAGNAAFLAGFVVFVWRLVNGHDPSLIVGLVLLAVGISLMMLPLIEKRRINASASATAEERPLKPEEPGKATPEIRAILTKRQVDRVTQRLETEEKRKQFVQQAYDLVARLEDNFSSDRPGEEIQLARESRAFARKARAFTLTEMPHRSGKLLAPSEEDQSLDGGDPVDLIRIVKSYLDAFGVPLPLNGGSPPKPLQLQQATQGLIGQGASLLAPETTPTQVNVWLQDVRVLVGRPNPDSTLDFRDLLYRVARNLHREASAQEVSDAINQSMAPLKIINRRLGGTP
jgi:hypothetical protein